MDLEKYYNWEQMPVSSIITIMVKWLNFDEVEFIIKTRNVESGMWFDATIIKGNDRYSVSAQTITLFKERLIKYLDKLNLREDYLKTKNAPD